MCACVCVCAHTFTCVCECTFVCACVFIPENIPPPAPPSPPPHTHTPGTDLAPIAPALENIWRDSKGQSMSAFNFRTVTSKFNELVYQYPIRIPARYSLVIRSLLTQVGGAAVAAGHSHL